MDTCYGQENQALAGVLGLKGRAREIALEISVYDLNKDNGKEILFTKLETIFIREEKD